MPTMFLGLWLTLVVFAESLSSKRQSPSYEGSFKLWKRSPSGTETRFFGGRKRNPSNAASMQSFGSGITHMSIPAIGGHWRRSDDDSKR
jgi:hypothetical protein